MNRLFAYMPIRRGLLVATAALAFSVPLVADDTEIYKAEANLSGGTNPKVLIVFDDSGSMSEYVDEEKPAYDPGETYEVAVPANRIYWSTDGTKPRTNSTNWFPATKNRCASSYDPLSTLGIFSPNRALRWRDSYEVRDQCVDVCPTGSTYQNPPGVGGGFSCFEQTTVQVPVDKWVYYGPLSGGRCTGSRQYINVIGVGAACYTTQPSSVSSSGYIYKQNDTGNVCPVGTRRLVFGTSSSSTDACYEQVGSYTVGELQWVDRGDPTEQCRVTVVPGQWLDLSSSVNNPTHVECVNDVTTGVTNNGPDTSMVGYPQHNVVSGSEYGPSVDDTVPWTDAKGYTFFTSHYLNYHYDDSIIVSRKKMDIAQEVVTTIIESNPGVDFGLVEFNYSQGGRVARRIVDTESMTVADAAASRADLVSHVNLMEHGGSTPMCESMWESYLYLAGGTPHYYTSTSTGTSTYYGREWDHDSQHYPPLYYDPQAISGGKYVSPSADCAYTYVILMTDGVPSSDTDANQRIKDLVPGDTTCESYETFDGSFKENCLPQLAQYMSNNDLDDDPANGDQFGITYTIGFQTDQDLLSDTATMGKGKYYTAFSASALAEAFQGAIIDILSNDSTFTSPAVAVDSFTRTQSLNDVYYAMFRPAISVNWIGNIKKLELDMSDGDAVLVDADGISALDPATGALLDTARTFWSAVDDGGDVDKGGVGGLLAARDPATRKILTNVGTNGALLDFNITNVTAAALGVTNTELYRLFGAASQTAFAQQVAWSRGYDIYDEDGDATTDIRPWILGDIMHSQPLVINYGATGGSFTIRNPEQRIVVGTNAGFVHMFGADDGVEDWAFLPVELYGIQDDRRKNALSSDNIYGMDLTPVTYTHDVGRDGTLDHTDGDVVVAVFGMRLGGHSYYALDLSNPDAPEFMWRISPDTTGFEELALTWSEPRLTTIPGYRDDDGVAKPVFVIGAGYDIDKDAQGVGAPDDSGRGIFIVDVMTGELVWSITPAANSATNMQELGLEHSVAANVSLVDSNTDGLTDRIYFSTTGGEVWRVDLPGDTLPTSSQNTWFISKLADLNDSTTSGDRRFFAAPDVVRIRRPNGDPVDVLNIGSGDRSNPNSVDVEDRLYSIRDPAVTVYTKAKNCGDPELADSRCKTLTDDDLYDISDNIIAAGTDEEEVKDAIEELNLASGWRMDLEGPGEKSLAETLTIDGTIFAPSFTPANLIADINTCKPTPGAGQLYLINLYTGGRTVITVGPIIPDTPSLHFAEDGTIRLLLPPGVPNVGQPGPPYLNCEGSVCDIDASLRTPYGNYWFQENY